MPLNTTALPGFLPEVKASLRHLANLLQMAILLGAFCRVQLFLLGLAAVRLISSALTSHHLQESPGTMISPLHTKKLPLMEWLRTASLSTANSQDR